jgi:hypothetical protein
MPFWRIQSLIGAEGVQRPMVLAWWKWDQRIDKENYVYLALHLERENQWNKDEDTIDKLFSKTDWNFGLFCVKKYKSKTFTITI